MRRKRSVIRRTILSIRRRPGGRRPCDRTATIALGLLSTRVLAYIAYQATPRDPLVLAGVVVAMALLGLVAAWIPAQRAPSVNPMILLRED